MEKENTLYKFFEEITPAELSKLREKRQETSTRDKNLLLKKVAEIEEILTKNFISINLLVNTMKLQTHKN